MARIAGPQRKVKVIAVTKREVMFIHETSGRKTHLNRYRVSTIKFDQPASATLYLRAHDKPERFPK